MAGDHKQKDYKMPVDYDHAKEKSFSVTICTGIQNYLRLYLRWLMMTVVLLCIDTKKQAM